MTLRDQWTTVADLRRALVACPPGQAGWRTFEEVALAALTHLFVPPLVTPRIQARTLSGLERRDAIFPSRSVDPSAPWGLLHRELDARMILVEFKCFDRTGIGKDETDQVRNYMKPTMGRLALVCCNKVPQRAAVTRRNQIYSIERKVILFLTTQDLLEMVDMKERGDDPTHFVLDLYETFLIEHE